MVATSLFDLAGTGRFAPPRRHAAAVLEGSLPCCGAAGRGSPFTTSTPFTTSLPTPPLLPPPSPPSATCPATPPCSRLPLQPPTKPRRLTRTNFVVRCCNVHSQTQLHSCKLVVAVKEKLEKEHSTLPVGKNGRDDEEMILWFLKDCKFSVEDAVSKLTKAIKWRQDFEVSKLTEDAVKDLTQTGKGYVHEFLDINYRPVLVVVASKHVPLAHDPADDERFCVFLIEKALSKLPTGKEQILGIIDLRGFTTENADLKFLTFLFDVFYYYYPKRLSQVLFVDAPFVFKPIWQLVKPLLKSYASLVRFCSAETVRKEYFTDETLPPSFRD